ncbi:hypothetical protein HK405_003196 [Cladochytrium tenue]|nr:hypothetical protein HK405_003196 [Cladochytrium tenue]
MSLPSAVAAAASGVLPRSRMATVAALLHGSFSTAALRHLACPAASPAALQARRRQQPYSSYSLPPLPDDSAAAPASGSKAGADSAPTPPSPAAQRPVKLTVPALQRRRLNGERIAMATAHDYPSGLLADRAGVDAVLVGDSLAMVALGLDSTTEVSLDDMIHHARAVSRGVRRALLIGDLPFGSYEASPADAVRSAVRLVREGRVDAVKLEGGAEVVPAARAVATAGVPVFGHIGLTPQRANALGGFRVQGTTLEKAQRLVSDALALQNAGCFGIVLEAMPSAVAARITSLLSIPTIGIGAGPACSGQVLVQLDLLGVYDRFTPKSGGLFISP